MEEISIRRKITILMAATSIILILAILAVSYVVNKKNITELCESIFMILVFLLRILYMKVSTGTAKEMI